jgi:hypothetical protein
MFIHRDLKLFNNMVRDGRVVGISLRVGTLMIWNTQQHGMKTKFGGYQSLLAKFLDVYPDELEMKKTRQSWRGDP